MNFASLAVKVLLTVAFVAAGLAKLAGVYMMVATFEEIGVGQWFRYVTGIIEIAGAALLWVRGREIFGAGLLAVTMVGAVLALLIILGPSLVPALVLGLLATFIAWVHRDQLA